MMLRVPALRPPGKLPIPEAMKAFGGNAHSYEHDFWEFNYEVYRYLERLNDEGLIERYKAIVRNMKSLVSPDRHVIPVDSFLSSWYWYRKEHQTRLEFHIRNLELPIELPDIDPDRPVGPAPARPRSPNAGDVLFRFGSEKYMLPLLEKGKIRISAGSVYENMPGDLARSDKEASKHAFIAGRYASITTADGRVMNPIGDIKRTVSVPNYFLICMSGDWDVDLFNDFSADSCVVIKDPDAFAKRIEKAAASGPLRGWYFHHNPVHYFDPYQRLRNEVFDAGMCKDFRFAYQREYRFMWLHLSGKIEASGFESLNLGPLNDIAEIHRRGDWIQKAYKG